MTERSVTHASFTLERTYPASPARVFAAWADPTIKTRWFAGGDEEVTEYRLDFSVGGRERAAGNAPNNLSYTYDALYQDIVPDERIVLTYEMHLDKTRISVSLGTTEFKPSGTGTRLIYTEQAVFLDGHDDAGSREQGSGGLFDKLARFLETQ